MRDLSVFLQTLVAASVLFVWMVRYANIIQEFKQYGLPDWLRDLVSVLKLTLALLLLIGVERPQFAVVGGVGIALLMLAAFATHLRVKSLVFKMLPCLGLLVLATLIAWINLGSSAK